MNKQYINPIKIIDAPCGYGKTQWAIQYMNENPDKRFIFITPYLDEVTRIKRDCPKLKFKEPKDHSRSKSRDLKRLLAKGHNIVSTHSLFMNIDDNIVELFKMNNYTLILDEVMEVVKEVNITSYDLESLKKDYINIDEEIGLVSVTEKGMDYKGKHQYIIDNAKLGRLLRVYDTHLIWQFPVDVFSLFEQVYNLTYLFDGQLQYAYYKLHNVPMELFTVKEDVEDANGETIKRYNLADYKHQDDLAFKERLRANVNIYDGKLNEVGNNPYALSYNWYDSKASSDILERVKNDTYNYFRREAKGKSIENMWTCFKDQQKDIAGDGYARGFVPHNARATNKYKHKENLAYLVNRFARVPIKHYFTDNGVNLDEDTYALSELIQWVWRSAVRDKKPINLYLPSSRMRHLFKLWMGLPCEQEYALVTAPRRRNRKNQ